MTLPSSVSLGVPRGWQKWTRMQGQPLGIDSSLLYYGACLARRSTPGVDRKRRQPRRWAVSPARCGGNWGHGRWPSLEEDGHCWSRAPLFWLQAK